MHTKMRNLNDFPFTHKYGTGRCRMHEPDIIKMYYCITAQFSTYPHSIVLLVVVYQRFRLMKVLIWVRFMQYDHLVLCIRATLHATIRHQKLKLALENKQPCAVPTQPLFLHLLPRGKKFKRQKCIASMIDKNVIVAKSCVYHEGFGV